MSKGGVVARTERSFEIVDSMSPEMRAVVHEYGYAIVQACLNVGVRKPNHIRLLVQEIWAGARQPRQRTGKVGAHTNGARTLDWVLIQAGAEINAATLVRVLRDYSLAVVPIDPSQAMVNASMDAVNHMGVVSKSVKHKNRLRAAIRAGMAQFWPSLADDSNKAA